MTKQITKDQLFELMEENGAHKIDEWSTKHDCHLETWILPFEDKFWKVSIEFSYNDGIIDDKFNMQEAESYTETITKWRVKKSEIQPTSCKPKRKINL